MTAPTYSELSDPTQGGPGFYPEAWDARLLTIMAILASGQYPDGSPYSGGGGGGGGAAPFTVLTNTVFDNGLTDNEPYWATQLAALESAGGGIALLPASTSSAGAASTVQVPECVQLLGLGSCDQKNTNTPPALGATLGSNICPTNAGSYANGLVELAGDTAVLGNIGIFGAGCANAGGTGVNIPGPTVVVNAKRTQLTNAFIFGGMIGYYSRGAGNAAQDSNIDNCVMVNAGYGFATPACYTIIATQVGAASGATLTVSGGASIVPGMIAIDLNSGGASTTGLYVKSNVGGSTITFNGNPSGANGHKIAFIAGVNASFNASDLMISRLRSLSGCIVNAASDVQQDQCHYSSPGDTTLSTYNYFSCSNEGSQITNTTFDCGNGLSAGLILRVNGPFNAVAPSCLLGGTNNMDIITDQGSDTAAGSTITGILSSLVGGSTASFSSIVNYLGSAGNAYDCITDNSFPASILTAYYRGGGTPGILRGNSIGGVYQTTDYPIGGTWNLNQIVQANPTVASLQMNGQKIVGGAVGTNGNDFMTKSNSFDQFNGGVAAGAISMDTHQINFLQAGTLPSDAARLGQVTPDWIVLNNLVGAQCDPAQIIAGTVQLAAETLYVIKLMLYGLTTADVLFFVETPEAATGGGAICALLPSLPASGGSATVLGSATTAFDTALNNGGQSSAALATSGLTLGPAYLCLWMPSGWSGTYPTLYCNATLSTIISANTTGAGTPRLAKASSATSPFAASAWPTLTTASATAPWMALK